MQVVGQSDVLVAHEAHGARTVALPRNARADDRRRRRAHHRRNRPRHSCVIERARERPRRRAECEESRDHDRRTLTLLGRERAHGFVAVAIARNPAGAEERGETETAWREHGGNQSKTAFHAASLTRPWTNRLPSAEAGPLPPPSWKPQSQYDVGENPDSRTPHVRHRVPSE